MTVKEIKSAMGKTLNVLGYLNPATVEVLTNSIYEAGKQNDLSDAAIRPHQSSKCRQVCQGPGPHGADP